jgi:hypothetical protein
MLYLSNIKLPDEEIISIELNFEVLCSSQDL